MDRLETQIRDALTKRKAWEDKQIAAYKIRHTGVPRGASPYPNAPDNNSQLSDVTIEKQKSFFVQQLYANEVVAAFIPRKGQSNDNANACAKWFDYKVKEESNFQREAISAIDTLLQGGGCPVKIRWDAKKKRLSFTACDPLHVIVPAHTEELKDADWLCHVIQLSEAQYRRNKNYRQDDDFIKSIKGRGTAEESDASRQDVEMREGITCGVDNDQIILWEIQERDCDDETKIMVKTRSPLRFEEPVRPDFERPYSEGVLKEGQINFVKWRPEITRKGYHAPRGIPEILGRKEAFMNKCLNYIGEHMDFHSRPMFEQSGSTLGNTGNFKSSPGAIVPDGLKPVIPPPVPSMLMPMLNYTREDAEHRAQTPDFGVLEQNGGKRTATEVQQISQQSGQGTVMKSRVFRLDLNDTYLMAWAILLQYGKDSLSYIVEDENNELDSAALQDCYEVRPSGTADSWDRTTQMNKAVARMQLYKDDPYIKQGPLRKNTLAADEPGLVKALYQEPQDAQQGEMEDQHVELLLMTNKFAAAVDPTDDDKTHLQVIAQWFQTRITEPEPIHPITAGLVFQHIQGHGQALHAKKDPMVKQIDMAMKPISAALLAIMQAAQAAAQPNVVQMPQPEAAPAPESQPAVAT